MAIVYTFLSVSLIFLGVMIAHIKLSDEYYQLHEVVDKSGDVHYEITYRYLIFFRLTYDSYIFKEHAEAMLQHLNNEIINKNK